MIDWRPVKFTLLWLVLFGGFAILIARLAHAGDLPDAMLTPGVARPGVTAADLCPVAHTRALRNVPRGEKKRVYAEYGIDPYGPGSPFEVDHLIPLLIGGANDIGNLWPEPFGTQPWNARVKDRLEDRLHALVCAGTVTLQDAQHDIATDWIAAYKKLFPGTVN